MHKALRPNAGGPADGGAGLLPCRVPSAWRPARPGCPGGQELYNETFQELGLPHDYETLMLVAAQAEITHFVLLWASMEEELTEIPLTEFAKDPQSVFAVLERFFEEEGFRP